MRHDGGQGGSLVGYETERARIKRRIAYENKALSEIVSQLKATLKKHQALFELAPDALMIVDDEGNITEVNRIFEQLTANKRSDVVGKKIWELCGMNELITSNAIYRKLLKKKSSSFYDPPIRHKCGKIKNVYIILNTYNVGKRKYMEIIVADVSEEIKAAKKIAMNSAHQTALLHALPDLYFHLDKNGVIIGSNEPKGGKFYVPPSVFMNKPVSSVLPPDVAQLTTSNLAKALKTGQLQTYNYTLQMKEGLAYFDCRMVPLGTDEAVAIVRDMTEIQKAQKEHYLLEEQKKVEQAKGLFLTLVSHELRTPLTISLAQIQMVYADYFGRINDPQKEALSIAKRNLRRLNELIEDFIVVNQIENASLKFNYMDCNLAEYALELVGEMHSLMPERNIKIEPKIGRLPTAKTDPGRIMQVLKNLIGNAIKFSEPNAKVVVGAEASGKDILFYVRNFGPPIEKSVQDKLFQPFYQAESLLSRAHGGLGLGLTICRGIVQSQGGKIWFESSVSKPTTFYFTVPRTPPKTIKPIQLI